MGRARGHGRGRGRVTEEEIVVIPDPEPEPNPEDFVEQLPSAPSWCTLTQLSAPGASCKVLVTGGYGAWSGSGLAVDSDSWQEQHDINGGGYSAKANINVGDELTLNLSATDVVTVRLFGKNITGVSTDYVEATLTIIAAGATIYVLPTAAGAADGTSFANALGEASLTAAVTAAGPQGIVYMGTHQGAYSGGRTLASGGSAGHPVTIEGLSAGGSTFPDATTTGYSGSPVASGDITTSSNGQTISGKLVTGKIQVNHNNVTITDCKVIQTGFYGIQVASGKTGVIIEDTEIDGNEQYTGILTEGPGSIIRRCNIHTCENAIVPGEVNILIQDNYIHDLSSSGNPDPHYDGVEVLGSVPGLEITGNTILMPNETAAVNLAAFFGSIDDVLVDSNYFAYGSNTIICDDQFNPAYNLTNITISNNQILPTSPGTAYLFRGGQANVGVTLTNNTILTAPLSGGAPASDAVVFSGTRTPFTLPADSETVTDVSGYTAGNELIRLNAGASHLRFKNFSVENFATGFMLNGALTGIIFDDIEAANFTRLWDCNGTNSMTGWTVRRVNAVGFSRAVARIQNASTKVNFVDVVGNSGRQSGGNFAVGVQIEDTATKAVFINCDMSNCHDTVNAYYNGDGFSTEFANIEFAWIDCTVTGCTDGGWDCKGGDHWLVRPISTGNKRNYRLWGSSGLFITLIDPISLNPFHRGGTGGAAHFWAGSDCDLMLVRSTMTDVSGTPAVYLMDGSYTYGSIIRKVESPTVTTTGTLNDWSAPNDVFLVQFPNETAGPDTDTTIFTNQNEKTVFDYQITADVDFVIHKQSGKDSDLYTVTRPGAISMGGKLFEFDVSLDGNNRYDMDLIAYGPMRQETAISVQTTIIDVDVDPVPLVLYVRPVQHGDGSGLDWANAAAGSAINTMIDRVGPGGVVALRADEGDYGALGITITNGGTADEPVLIEGRDVNGDPMKARFVSNRPTWTLPVSFNPIAMTSATGGTVFNINASHLDFQHLHFERVEKAFSAGGSFSNLTIGNITGYNTRHGFYANTAADVITDLHFHDWSWVGFSKDNIRLRGQIDTVLIEDVIGNSGWQTDDNFPAGIRTGSGSATTNVEIYRTTYFNCYEDLGSGNFAQGEGFNNERGDTDWYLEDCESYNNSDAGCDMKGERLHFKTCNFHDNRRNWRLWGTGNVLENCTGGRVRYWVSGDSGGPCMVWMGNQTSNLGNGPELQIIGGTFNGGVIDAVNDPLSAQPYPFIQIEGYNGIVRESGTLTKTNVTANSVEQPSYLTYITNALADPAPTITTSATANIYKNVRNFIDLTSNQGVVWTATNDPDGVAAITLSRVVLDRGNQLRISAQPYIGGGDNTRDVTVTASNANKATTDKVITATILDEIPPWTLEADFEGANGATSDTAESGQVLTFNNGAALTTTTPLAGSSSLLLDGTNDYVTVPSSSNWLLSGGVTMAVKFRATALSASLSTLISYWQASGTARSFAFGIQSGEFIFYHSYNGASSGVFSIATTGAGIVTGTTYTVILDRDDNDLIRIYLASGAATTATMIYSGTVSGGLRDPFPAQNLNIGALAGGSSPFGGRIDSVRFMSGYAPFASDSGIVLADLA